MKAVPNKNLNTFTVIVRLSRLTPAAPPPAEDASPPSAPTLFRQTRFERPQKTPPRPPMSAKASIRTFGAAEIFKNKQSENKQDYYSFPKINTCQQKIHSRAMLATSNIPLPSRSLRFITEGRQTIDMPIISPMFATTRRRSCLPLCQDFPPPWL